ncbi:MAG: glycoside hydrolase family 2 [Cyclobacteriaceae bacterium]|nr:glycoside hydrolase family 2 [Cyclobacteriaceae bacterium]
MRLTINLSFLLLLFSINASLAQQIPLAEHPRPDFQRPEWQNLNGQWSFMFDPENKGMDSEWQKGSMAFDKTVTVPFPWGSQLSGVKDEADIAWYQREIKINEAWKGKKIFLTIGASDWETSVWLDGQLLGTHQGGYVPFSFELTPFVKFGSTQKLVVRADDTRRDFTLYGKQGYGNARGIWQTVYLEARGQVFLDAIHFTPDIDNNKLTVTAYLQAPAEKDLSLSLNIKTEGEPIQFQTQINKGKYKTVFEMDIPNPHLWNLEDPYLYDVVAKLEDDEVHTYFGMRKISVVNMPGTDIPYIALNNQPIYLQLALDQSYHPEGFYTFPSDQFMKEEILRSKSIGLNGIRTHIKVEIPRKLYWADKLGLLVMEDLPNSWGEPDRYMQKESEFTLREMIKRDYNHPSIFSWVTFNETWGLFTTVGKDENDRDIREYLPETQQWVASMYYLAKSLDGSRLVEDNSICCGRGHTETDINSWHSYLPGYEWDNYLKVMTENTFEGSTNDFEEGFKQGKQPNINSECGNVWGYSGSTGDVDWSWDYHRMMNSFRRYPQVAGWLYTEHHDVINEWNGYWRFDRSEKDTGIGDMVEGMTLKDFHSAVYLSMENEICKTAQAGETVSIPLFLSVMTGKHFGNEVAVQYDLTFTNTLGKSAKILSEKRQEVYQPWMQKELAPLSLTMPDYNGIATLAVRVTDEKGNTLHRNFMNFEVVSGKALPATSIFSTSADSYTGAEWSKRVWNVMDGKKVNGAGKGFFEYEIEVPKDFNPKKSKKAYFLIEVSAKELFAKDIEKEQTGNLDFMKGARALPSSNPNSYPMTDELQFPSTITISINGQKMTTTTLADDPADHRGVLSWHHQLQDSKLREAGSYGYLVKVPVSKTLLKNIAEEGKLKVRLETTGEGGIAIYGKEFGRYAIDPGLVVEMK